MVRKRSGRIDTYSTPIYVGAHFVAYERVGTEYVAYNTNLENGISTFSSPSEYAYHGKRFHAVVIFIYE